MGSKILDATISGSPMISPFEEKRHRSGHYENDEFREFVKQQMGEDWYKPQKQEEEKKVEEKEEKGQETTDVDETIVVEKDTETT